MTIDSNEGAEVRLGSEIFHVPMLAARQNRIVDPLILSLLPLFAGWQEGSAASLAGLGAKEYEALQEIAFQGIRAAQPNFTREAFLEMKVTLPELVAAFGVIAQQTGIFAKGPPGE